MSSLSVFLTTYNTGLEGSKAQEQDLSGWLIPVLHSATEDKSAAEVPDIYAIGVQELLPLHLAFSGLSHPTLIALTQRIQSLLSAHATSVSPDRTPETYSLVARVSHVGVALWVFARDRTTSGRLGKPLEASVGLWRFGMGNKAAVGVRVPIMRGAKEGGWETLTFVSAHLEAHDHNIGKRNEQYDQILSSLVFNSGDALQHPVLPYETSHLFVMGDLNYRLARLPTPGVYPSPVNKTDVLTLEKERAAMVNLETLKREQIAGRAFGGMREGDLTRFAPTYKRIVGEVEGYSQKRIPGWTDRILFASYTDPAELYAPEAIPGEAPQTTTQIIQYSSTPALKISDHKPVHALLLLPPVQHASPSPAMAPVLPPTQPPSRPRPAARPVDELVFWRVVGTTLDRLVGWPWLILVLLGFGNEKAGMGIGALLSLLWGIWWSGILGTGGFSA